MVDLFKSVNWNDGEGIVFGDLNDGQRYLSARLYDQILENLIGSVALTSTDPDLNGQRGVDAPTHLAYVLHGGSAYLKQGSANNKIKIAPGVLFQKTAAQTGNEHTLLGYAMDGTTELTIANGDATNPRVDIVQMALAYVTDDSQSRDFQDAVTGASSSQPLNKKRQVGITISIKQGAPAASPTYPDPDPGFVCVAGIVVGATYAGAAGLIFGEDTAGAVAVVHDQRMPVNVQAYREDPALFKLITAWSLTANGCTASASNNTNDLRAFCGKAGSTGRVVGIEFARADLVSTITLGNDGGGGNAFTSKNTCGAFGVASTPIAVPYYTFEGHHAPAAGPTVLPSATNKIGVPLWTNGYACARPNASAVSATNPGRVCARVQSGSLITTMGAFLWYVAQGI